MGRPSTPADPEAERIRVSPQKENPPKKIEKHKIIRNRLKR